MIPGPFDYVAPASLDEAVQALAQHGDEAKVLAGGHSLIPLMKLRLSAPSLLVDIGRIPALRGITRNNGIVTIGATTTHAEIESSRELGALFPLLQQAASVIGDPMVRNRGTFGGSLAHADPAADWPAVALALGVTVHATGPRGERAIPIDGFFVDMLTTALEPDEVLTAIDVPVLPEKTGSAYLKATHPASGYAVTGVAAVVTTDENGTCRACRIGITGAGARAVRASAVEAALTGQQLTPALIEEAAQQAAEGIDFLGDLYASTSYRARLVAVYTKRALLDALGART